MNNENIKTFYRKLKQFRTEYCIGSLLGAIMHSISIAVIILPILVIADYFFAFNNKSLKIIDIVILIFIATSTLFLIIKALNFSLKNTAKTLDSLNKDNPEIFLSSYELGNDKQNQKSSSIRTFLLDKVFQQAADNIKKIKHGSIFPTRLIIKKLIFLIIVSSIAATALMLPINITSVILNRIFHPNSDIPPYSPYSFILTPSNPAVVFGDSLELNLKIDGPPVEQTVLLKTKFNEKINSVTCYNASNNTYTSKIEKLTRPLEFWFTVGKARTKHYRVKLKLRPKIVLAKIHLKYPEYTHIPDKNFILARNSIKVMPNSIVTLTLFSNRPLSAGTLILTDNNKNKNIVNGVKTNAQSVSFSWKATRKASLNALIYDIRGTANSNPLKFKQFILKDNPPDVSIISPDSFALATPDAIIKLSGYAEDDIGLKRVNIIKTVSGYRDRMFFLGPQKVSKRFDFSDTLNLLKLGLVPGNIIEIYAEAADFNPSLDGLALSKLVKIQIISKEEYANLLRTRTHVELVLKRYSEMMNLFFKMREQLETSIETLTSKQDANTKKNILKKLNALNNKIFDSFKKLIKEFPIFEMEKNQKKTLRKLFNKAFKNQQQLAKLSENSSANSISEKLKQLLSKWNESEQEIKKNQKNLNDLIAYTAIMHDAAKLKKIYMDQKEIVTRLSRFKLNDIASGSAMLKKIAIKEAELAKNLTTLQTKLKQDAEALSDKFWKIKQDAADMAERINISKIPQLLAKAASAAKKDFASEAYIEAAKALEKLKSLLNPDSQKSNCISKLANGTLPSQNGTGKLSDSIKKTAREILDSILRNECNKPGKGNGIGTGTGGAYGYSTGNSSSINVPLFGPMRSLGTGAGGIGNADNKSNENSGTSVKIISVEDNPNLRNQYKSNSENINIEEAPFKYRNAVKKYFSD